MLTIYKFPLRMDDIQRIKLPAGAHPLHVGFDPQGTMCVWVKGEFETAEEVPFDFYIVGTGNPMTSNSAVHVGSVVQGAFVWHLFYAVAPW